MRGYGVRFGVVSLAYLFAVTAVAQTDIGDNVSAPSGDISNPAENAFPGYVAAISEAKRAAQSICDAIYKPATTFYLVDGESLASMAQTQSISVEVERRAKLLDGELESIQAKLKSSQVAVASEELATISGSIGTAGSLVKSVAGLAQLFRKEVAYAGIDVTIDAADVAVMLRNCPTQPLIIVNPAELVAIPTPSLFKLLVATQSNIDDVLVNVEYRIAQMSMNKPDQSDDPEKLAQLMAFKLALEAMKTVWATTVQNFTTVRADKNVSDLVLAERNKHILDQVGTNSSRFLNLAIRRTGAISRTTKSLFGSQKQHFAGGIAVRYQVQDASGNVEQSGIEYGQSKWFSLDGKNAKKGKADIELRSSEHEGR